MTGYEHPSRRAFLTCGAATAAAAVAGCSGAAPESTATDRPPSDDILTYVPRADLVASEDRHFVYRYELAPLAQLDLATDAADFQWMEDATRRDLRKLGLSPGEIETWVTARPEFDNALADLHVVAGGFDTAGVRDHLVDFDFAPVDPPGPEVPADARVFEPTDAGDQAVALHDGVVLLAENDPLEVLDAAFRARSGEGETRIVEANDAASALLDRLEGQFVGARLLDTAGRYFRGEAVIEGLSANGLAYQFEEQRVRCTRSLVFPSADDADPSAVREWVRDSESLATWRDRAVSRDGRIVDVTGTVPLEGFEP